ncbi:MAG: leucine-rich repeat domain-containing protein [Lachnospiraceae bacterium]|nr:leucine-rich repeat domain-containing protein [Lachnospiraceae bacterium]
MLYEKYMGHDPFVTIESSAEYPITHIAPKAFLSCKSLQKLTLPDTIEHIGDWAFAHMQKLTDLTLPARPISFGKQVFLDCENLKRIHLTPNTSGNEGLPLLLGAAITILQDMSLLRPEQAGVFETHAGWLADFDKAVAAFVKSPDEQGFEPVFYGWFNDEDADSTQLPKYLHKHRSQKLELAFLRLRYDLYLSKPLKALLQGYLTDHLPEELTKHLPATAADRKVLPYNDSPAVPSPQPPRHTITWEQLPEYCRNEITYIKILEEAGAFTSTNIPAFLTHLQDAAPEIKAYLLRLQSSLQEKNDFFDNFSL